MIAVEGQCGADSDSDEEDDEGTDMTGVETGMMALGATRASDTNH